MANVRQTNIPGFDIPEFDYVGLTYHGSTNTVETATYKAGGASGTTVAVIELAYVGGTPSADDAPLASATRTS
jgi:hypothetical protein